MVEVLQTGTHCHRQQTSHTSAVTCSIATLTGSGTAGLLACDASFWYSLLTVVPTLGVFLVPRLRPTTRQASGGGPPPQTSMITGTTSHVSSPPAFETEPEHGSPSRISGPGNVRRWTFVTDQPHEATTCWTSKDDKAGPPGHCQFQGGSSQ
jgi:hypothetical protein